jgi:hypothetical protein
MNSTHHEVEHTENRAYVPRFINVICCVTVFSGIVLAKTDDC